ncbi:hypothetical protein SprV_0301205700 [Sparganum proliferum]
MDEEMTPDLQSHNSPTSPHAAFTNAHAITSASNPTASTSITSTPIHYAPDAPAPSTTASSTTPATTPTTTTITTSPIPTVYAPSTTNLNTIAPTNGNADSIPACPHRSRTLTSRIGLVGSLQIYCKVTGEPAS